MSFLQILLVSESSAIVTLIIRVVMASDFVQGTAFHSPLEGTHAGVTLSKRNEDQSHAIQGL